MLEAILRCACLRLELIIDENFRHHLQCDSDNSCVRNIIMLQQH